VDSIWWKAYAKSIEQFNQPDKLRIQKFTNDWWPTNKRAHRYCNDNSCTCSACQTEMEYEDHIIKCKTQTRQKIRVAWLSSLEEFLSSSHTPGSVKSIILYNM
jgi:hypothetical protein